MAASLDPGVSRQRTAVDRLLGGGRLLLGVLIAFAGVIAGVGWLYILRQFDPLRHGPVIDGALPLQQLAGGDSQPLLRVLVAWIPVGLVTGYAMARAARLGRLSRVVIVVTVALVILWLAGASSDAITVNQRFVDHFWNQTARTGIWLGMGLIAAAAALPGKGRERRARSGMLPGPLLGNVSRRGS